jgi:uncharacterized Zn finger protein (UPF0148 family)
MIEPKCPACAAGLRKVPQRKTKCPVCGQFMFVKYSPGNRVKRLVTQAEAEAIEAEWRMYHERERVTENLGLDKTDYDSVRSLMAAQFGEEQADWNTEYYFLNQSLKRTTDHRERKMLYLRLAIHSDKRGLDFKNPLAEMFREELLQHLHNSEIVIGVEIHKPSLPKVCHVCSDAHGTRLTVDEALQEMPLPHAGCTCEGLSGRPGYCRCEYYPLLRSDFE